MSTTTTPPPGTQHDALVAGSVRYRTGRPCGKGHVADRYARNGSCVECQRSYGLAGAMRLARAAAKASQP